MDQGLTRGEEGDKSVLTVLSRMLMRRRGKGLD